MQRLGGRHGPEGNGHTHGHFAAALTPREVRSDRLDPDRLPADQPRPRPPRPRPPSSGSTSTSTASTSTAFQRINLDLVLAVLVLVARPRHAARSALRTPRPLVAALPAADHTPKHWPSIGKHRSGGNPPKTRMEPTQNPNGTQTEPKRNPTRTRTEPKRNPQRTHAEPMPNQEGEGDILLVRSLPPPPPEGGGETPLSFLGRMAELPCSGFVRAPATFSVPLPPRSRPGPLEGQSAPATFEVATAAGSQKRTG